MKTCDYIAQFLASKRIDLGFVMTGTAIATLIDALATPPSPIRYICVHHEQAAAMAAEAYARSTGKTGLAIATSGPGATNLITGIAGAFYDCIPLFVITGQVATTDLKGQRKLLQRGFQEIDIVSMVQPITKYAVQITDPADLPQQLETAYHLAHAGRPGPVLIDLPMDIQAMDFAFCQTQPIPTQTDAHPIALQRALALMQQAKRPLILAGGGIRHANALEPFRAFIDRAQIPVVFSFAGLDTLPFTHPCHIGVLGQYGHGYANQLVQQTDLVIALGARFIKKLTGPDSHAFASNATLIAVNIDPDELADSPKPADLSVCMDIAPFLDALATLPLTPYPQWLVTARRSKQPLPVATTTPINPYAFIDSLSDQLPDPAIIIPDVGQNLVATVQAIRLKPRQRLFSSWANSPMGYALPAAIGAQLGNPSTPTIAIIGDGGLQLNLQSLETLAHHQLPIKILLFNNNGYVTIHEFQDKALQGRYAAADALHGYSHPDYRKLAAAFGIAYTNIRHHDQLPQLTDILAASHPLICEIAIDPQFRLSCPSFS